MVGIFENIGDSLKFGFRECYGDGFKGFLRMLGLLITCCIPIVFFIPMGIFLKVFRGEKPDFTNAGQSFIRGLLCFVIAILYILIPFILFAIFGGLGAIPAVTGGDAGAVFGGLLASAGIIIAIIAAVILGFVAIPAEINFARNGFAAAFKFSEIFGMIFKGRICKIHPFLHCLNHRFLYLWTPLCNPGSWIYYCNPCNNSVYLLHVQILGKPLCCIKPAKTIFYIFSVFFLFRYV